MYKRGAAYEPLTNPKVKGGEGSAQPFTSRAPSVYRGFS